MHVGVEVEMASELSERLVLLVGATQTQGTVPSSMWRLVEAPPWCARPLMTRMKGGLNTSRSWK